MIDKEHLITIQVTRQEILAMPIEIRRSILARQATAFLISNPEYFFTDEELDKQAMQDKGMME